MKKGYIIVTVLLLLSGNAEAQILTVRDAISRSLEKNHLVKAAGHNVTAAWQALVVANSGYYPAVSIEETLSASNAPTQTFMMKLDQGRFSQDDFKIGNLNHPSAWHDFKTALTVRQPIYVPSLSPLSRLASKETEKTELGLDMIRQDTAFQVFGLYLNVQRTEAQLKAADKAMADARENMRLATVRTAVGVGLKSDELRARTHLALIDQQRITARNNLVLAKLRLAFAIGLPEDQPIEVSGELEHVRMPLSNEGAVELALAKRVDLKRSMIEIEKSDAAVKLANSDYLPTLGAFASYQLNSRNAPFAADNDGWLAGVTLKWQLFDGFHRSGERNRAVANRSAAQEMFENRISDVRYQLKESQLRCEEAGKRLEVARHALTDAEEAVRLISKRFENALATMMELLDAQTVLDQARSNLVDSEANYVLAGGQVHYSAGTFLEEMLK